MCGIAGIVGGDSSETAEHAARLTHALSHRGPDGGGLLALGDAVFGHRRLAIHDLSAAGLQPFQDERRERMSVVNGDFYDAVALRAEVLADGVRLKSRSDSELLLPLYRRRGDALFPRLRGPFALAIFDAPRRALVLARDRFGKKSLFYTLRDGALWFASEPGPLARAVGAKPRCDVLLPFLRQGYLAAPETAFVGVRALPPASTLHWRIGDAEPTVTRYWTPPGTDATDPRSDDELARATATALDDAVRIRLGGDRPLGVLLSGGLDSAAVLASANAASSRPLVAYTASFDDRRFDESAAARETAAHLRSAQTFVSVGDGVADRLARMIRTSGDLLADSSVLALGAVAERAAADGVVVLLTGDGGDEMFLGYDRQYAAAYGAVKLQAAALLGGVPGFSRSARIAKAVAAAGLPPRLAYAELASHSNRRVLAEFVVADALLADDPLFAAYERRPASEDVLADLGTLDVLESLPYDLLVKADRAAMSAGVELRSPFLDPALAEFALKLPGLRRTDGRASKKPLRRLLEQRGLGFVAARKKKGFGVPLRAWLTTGPLARLADELLHDVRAPFAGVLKSGSAATALAALRAGAPIEAFVYACLVAALHHDAHA